MKPGTKGQNAVTGVPKKNLLKRSQVLQDNKSIEHRATDKLGLQTYH